MKARLHYYRGRLLFVFLDSKGQGLPVEIHPRAWRVSMYRMPKLAPGAQ